VQSYYAEGHSPRDSRVRFGISRDEWQDAVQQGLISQRSHAHGRRGETRARVEKLLGEGLSQAAVARALGVSKPTVSFHARQLGIPARSELAKRFDWDAIAAYYSDGHSAQACQEHFGFSRSAWAQAIQRGEIMPRPRMEPTEDLLATRCRRCRSHIKSRLLVEGMKAARCEGCGLEQWLGQPLSLQLHHVNGDGLDNRLENLLILCPNCHSQTDTWGVRNRGRKRAA
jgi:5-methylcytosine-specific restriction endonuclease McrA